METLQIPSNMEQMTPQERSDHFGYDGYCDMNGHCYSYEQDAECADSYIKEIRELRAENKNLEEQLEDDTRQVHQLFAEKEKLKEQVEKLVKESETIEHIIRDKAPADVVELCKTVWFTGGDEEMTEEFVIREYGDESEQAKRYGFGMFNPEYVKALPKKNTEPASDSEPEDSEDEEVEVEETEEMKKLLKENEELKKKILGKFDDKREELTKKCMECEAEEDKYDGDDWKWVYGKEIFRHAEEVVLIMAGGGDHWENWTMTPNMNYIVNKDGKHPQNGKVLVQSSCGKYVSFQDEDYECEGDECICEYENCVEC